MEFFDLDTNSNGLLDDDDTCVLVDGGDAVLDLGAALGGPADEDTVIVSGVVELIESDFLFA